MIRLTVMPKLSLSQSQVALCFVIALVAASCESAPRAPSDTSSAAAPSAAPPGTDTLFSKRPNAPDTASFTTSGSNHKPPHRYLGPPKWNVWAENYRPEVQFEPVSKLRPAHKYLFVVDLAAIPYSGPAGIYTSTASDSL
jgi:hypothetical protein